MSISFRNITGMRAAQRPKREKVGCQKQHRQRYLSNKTWMDNKKTKCIIAS